MNFRELLKTHQQKIVLLVGYILVSSLAFTLGRITAFKYEVPEVKIESAFNPPASRPLNDTPKSGSVQSASVDNCEGKIKGNIGSSGKIYHMPGGVFYQRTNPEQCFNSEAEAKTAGFRKSSR